MRTFSALTTTLATATLIVASPGAHALTLDFGEAGSPSICSSTSDGLGALTACGNFSYLAQTYGDVANTVDVTYSAPRINDSRSLRWWSTNYNSLYGVAWADNGDTDSRARIELKPLTVGEGVTLTGFDLGAYVDTSRFTTVNIYAIGGGAPLYTFAGNVGNAGTNTPTSFAVNIHSDNGLWIEWQDSAYNVGIDRITYSVGSNVPAVPEPASMALMLAGLAGVGAVARRRRG